MGNKKQSSALGAGAASHPYQLHGGVILVPAPQHALILLQGKEGRKRRKSKKRGEGPKHLPARPAGWAARSGVVLCAPAAPGIPAPGAAAARWDPPRSPAPALPGSQASLARSPPASPASAKSNSSPCVRAPAPRSAGPLGRGGGPGPAGSPPPHRPAGCPARGPGVCGPDPRRGSCGTGRRGSGEGRGRGGWEERLSSRSPEAVGGQASRAAAQEGPRARGRRGREPRGCPAQAVACRSSRVLSPDSARTPLSRALSSACILFLRGTHSGTLSGHSGAAFKKQLEVDMPSLHPLRSAPNAHHTHTHSTTYTHTHTHASQSNWRWTYHRYPLRPCHPHTHTHTLSPPQPTPLQQQRLFPAA